MVQLEPKPKKSILCLNLKILNASKIGHLSYISSRPVLHLPDLRQVFSRGYDFGKIVFLLIFLFLLSCSSLIWVLL